MIWRASYTAIQPSSHLWIARPGDVRRWLSKDPAADELHVVTSNITASLEAGARAERHAHPLYVRPASKERSIKLQVLVG